MTVVPLKAFAAIDVIPGFTVPKESDVKYRLFAKAESPIVVTPAGKVMLVNDRLSFAFAKALAPISFTFGPSVTDLKTAPALKFGPKSTKPLPIVKAVTVLLNAYTGRVRVFAELVGPWIVAEVNELID